MRWWARISKSIRTEWPVMNIKTKTATFLRNSRKTGRSVTLSRFRRARLQGTTDWVCMAALKMLAKAIRPSFAQVKETPNRHRSEAWRVLSTNLRVDTRVYDLGPRWHLREGLPSTLPSRRCRGALMTKSMWLLSGKVKMDITHCEQVKLSRVSKTPTCRQEYSEIDNFIIHSLLF